MKKIYILDTNILLQNPHAMLLFKDNDIVIPDIVIDELDKKKKAVGEIGYNARLSARILEDIMLNNDGDFINGFKLENGGSIRVELNHKDIHMPDNWSEDADLRILRVCLGIKKDCESSDGDYKTILVTNDSYLKIKASILGIETEGYKNELSDGTYQGRRTLIMTDGQYIDKLYSHKSVEIDNKFIEVCMNYDKESLLQENEYVTIKCAYDSQSVLGIVKNKKIMPIIDTSNNPIKPKNSGQRFVLDALYRPASESPLVIVKGPAGTGKTILSIDAGLKSIEDKKYKKILYLRGNTKLDDDIGYLPGTEQEKMDWALRPVRDNLEIILSKEGNYDQKELKEKIDKIFEFNIISIEAVAHMRGRSVADTFVIIDEAQNLTPKQIKTLLSRASKGTKIVLLGDPYQIDHPFLNFNNNGLCYASDKMMGSELTYQITMLDSECERSDISMEIFNRMN